MGFRMGRFGVFLVFFNSVHMQYRMNETPSLRGFVRLDICEALRYYRDESTAPVGYVVLRRCISPGVRLSITAKRSGITLKSTQCR